MKTVIVLFIAFIALPTYSIPIKKGRRNLWQYSGKFEGDMVLRPDQKNGIIGDEYRWTNREVPYEIGPEYTASEKQFIKDALSAYDGTCLTVREREPTDTNYIYVTAAETGCFSDVGMQGGMQIVNLEQDGCLWNSTVVHEFLHAIGFHHEQCTYNRDNYVTIMWQNIEEGQEFNFKKYDRSEVTNYGFPYDYDSIMHYERTAFSINGLDTIVPKDPNAEIGITEVMSSIDIDKIMAMYDCT